MKAVRANPKATCSTQEEEVRKEGEGMVCRCLVVNRRLNTMIQVRGGRGSGRGRMGTRRSSDPSQMLPSSCSSVQCEKLDDGDS